MSDARELLRKNVERFAARELEPAFAPLRHHGIAPRSIVDSLFDLGVLDGMDAPDLAACLEAIARIEAAPAAMILAHASAARLLSEAGREIGERALLGFPLYDEPRGRPSMLRWRTRPKGVELEGHAQMIVNAPLASQLVVRARGDDGVRVLVVRADADGVTMSEPVATLGMRGCPVADVFFDRAIVPQNAIVAEADEALDRVARWARGPAVAISAGVLARSLETASEYARARIQGGGPIVDHHEVRRLLAGLMADLAFCRDAMHRLSGDAPEPEASLAFAEAKRRAAHATVDGVQILGGNGYMEDYFQERGMRDAKQAQALFGRADLCVQGAMGAWAAGGA